MVISEFRNLVIPTTTIIFLLDKDDLQNFVGFTTFTVKENIKNKENKISIMQKTNQIKLTAQIYKETVQNLQKSIFCLKYNNG